MVQRDQIYASTDPDDPTVVSGLASFSVAAGDTFPSGTLDPELKQAITKVFDQSSTWDEGGAATIPDGVSGLWEGASLFTQGASANVGAISATAGATSAIGTVSANIATNTASIGTNTTNITANTAEVGSINASIQPVSGDIATNTTLVEGVITNISPVSGDIATNTTNITGNTAAFTQAIVNIGATSSVSSTAFLTGADPTCANALDMDANNLKGVTELIANAAEITFRSATPADVVFLHGRDNIGLTLSANELSSIKSHLPIPVVGDAGALLSVPCSGYGEGDVVPDAIADGFGYVYHAADNRFYARNLVFQAAGSTGGSFANPTVAITNSTLSQLHFTTDLSSGPGDDLTVGGDLGVSGDTYMTGDLTVTGTPTLNKTLVVSSQNSVANTTGALPTIASLSCPSPPGGFCFLSAVGDGTAGTSEINFGAGTSVQGVSSVGRGGEDGYYLWNNTDNALEVSADGIYKVDFVGITEVAAALTITVSFYTGTALVHRFDLRVHSVTDPHNLVGSWVGFVGTTKAISVTINSGSGDNAQLLQSSTLFVQRLA